jgi:hypothetical protein
MSTNDTLLAGLLTRRYCSGEGRFGFCFRHVRTEAVFGQVSPPSDQCSVRIRERMELRNRCKSMVSKQHLENSENLVLILFVKRSRKVWPFASTTGTTERQFSMIPSSLLILSSTSSRCVLSSRRDSPNGDATFCSPWCVWTDISSFFHATIINFQQMLFF